MTALAPLPCAACAAPLALPDVVPPPAEVACRHCGTAVILPPAYREAIAATHALVAARRAAEPLWRVVASSPPGWLTSLGLVTTALAPAAATCLVFAADLPWSRLDTYVRAALPSLLPGAGLFVWAQAVRATVRDACAAAAAQPVERPGATVGCRRCGAPLQVAPGELSATCAYCGTDSLVAVDDAEARARRRGATAAQRSLADLVGALRRRRRLLALGITGALAAVGGAMLALGLAAGA